MTRSLRQFGTRALSALLLQAAVATLASPVVHAAEPANAAPWQKELVSAADGEIGSFYAYRSGPLWISSDGTPNAAAQAFLELARTAELDGLDPVALGYDELAAAVAALIEHPSPEANAHAEVTFTKVFSSYVSDLRDTSRSRMLYEHELLRPFVPQTYTTLEEAANAPSLEAYVREMGWMHPLYAQLRQAAVAGGMANASLVEATRVNLERLRALPASPGERYVLIDAGSAQLFMYENGKVVDSMKVVVGKREHQTPIMAGYLRYAVFNPYWNVPDYLIVENIAPRAKAQGQTYLRDRGYQVISDWVPDAEVLPSAQVDWSKVVRGDTVIKMRQLPNRYNSMGKAKFEFPNAEGIYLHDTPEREYLAREDRHLSNGCIRLEDYARLGRWLMSGPLPDVGNAPEQKVDLPTPVPIYVTYLTVRADGDQIAVRSDPYGLDTGAPQTPPQPELALGSR